MTPRKVRLIVLAIILPGCHSAAQELGVHVSNVDHVPMQPSGQYHKAHANVNREVRFTYLPADVQSIVWKSHKYEPVELDREIVEPILRSNLVDGHIGPPYGRKSEVVSGNLVVRSAEGEIACTLFRAPGHLRCRDGVQSRFYAFWLNTSSFTRLYDHISAACLRSQIPSPHEAEKKASKPFTLPDNVTRIDWVVHPHEPIELNRETIESILRRNLVDEHSERFEGRDRSSLTGLLVVRGEETENRCAIYKSPMGIQCWQDRDAFFFRIDTNDYGALHDYILAVCCQAKIKLPCRCKCGGE